MACQGNSAGRSTEMSMEQASAMASATEAAIRVPRTDKARRRRQPGTAAAVAPTSRRAASRVLRVAPQPSAATSVKKTDVKDAYRTSA